MPSRPLAPRLPLLMAVIMLIAAAPALADECVDYDGASFDPVMGAITLPDWADGVTLAGDRVYVSAYRNLMIVDATSPAEPALLGQLATPGLVRDIAVDVAGQLAYMLDDSIGLHAIDVSDPATPELVGRWDDDGIHWDLALVGDHLVVTHQPGNINHPTLKVLSLADPRVPVTVGSVDMPGDARQLDVAGDLVYIACGVYGGWRGLVIVDVSDPAHPVIVGQAEHEGAVLDWHNDIHVAGNEAYIAISNQGVRVCDVSDPTQPQFVALIETWDAARGVGVAEGILYTILYDGAMLVHDVADPANPGFIGHAPLGGQGRNLVATPDLVLLALDSGGLVFAYPQCVDVTPVTPDSETLDDGAPPDATRLTGAHPNPFNPRTTVTFRVSREQHVAVTVFDLLGRRVAGLVDRTLPAGDHATTWDGRDATGRGLPTGAYLVRLVTDERVSSRKLLLVR